MKKTKFINTVENLLKANDGMRISEASAPALYRAVSRATMADILDKWNKDQQKAKKRVGYLSAEFLVGRAVYANLYNLGSQFFQANISVYLNLFHFLYL